MIHYHGGPITPDTCAIKAWTGRHAFISYARPDQINLAAAVCQSFALDNGAFSAWKSKRLVDWGEYYKWVDMWRRHPGFDFAVVPDVIEGEEADNDALADEWPFPAHEAAVVWHTNESTERLQRLSREWPRVAIGSSGEYDVKNPKAAVERLRNVLPFICDSRGMPICKLHGLRMLNPEIFRRIPLSSADSTNVARNIGIDKKWIGPYQPASKETRTAVLVERIEQHNSAATMNAANDNPQQMTLFY